MVEGEGTEKEVLRVHRTHEAQRELKDRRQGKVR